MMAEEDMLLLVKFVLFRFIGVMPEDRMLVNAIGDWKREAFSWPEGTDKLG